MATARKRKPGRPPRADRAEIEAKVLAAIRVGLTLPKACLACGVPYQTVEHWIRTGGDEFSARAKAAIAEREMLWLNEVRHQERGWQRIAWLLERTCPEEYGRKDRVQAEVSGPSGGPIVVQVDADATPDQVARAVAEALARANSSDNA
jgi:hypothetical protein